MAFLNMDPNWPSWETVRMRQHHRPPQKGDWWRTIIFLLKGAVILVAIVFGLWGLTEIGFLPLIDSSPPPIDVMPGSEHQYNR